MMFTVMNEATFLCVSAVGGRRSGWMGGYKMQDSDSRDRAQILSPVCVQVWFRLVKDAAVA